MIGERYLEHLTDGDLRMLAEAADAPATNLDDAVSYLRSRPDQIQRHMADPGMYDRLFSATGGEVFVGASPFLTFAVLVERAARDLGRAPFVMEWTATRSRVPLFDAGELGGFLESSSHRLFLAELLASYTHTVSGVIWRRDVRRWRAHRFSELDPVRLAALLEVVPEEEHSGVYRRLGDAALFLSGVFPDYTDRWVSSPLNHERLGRTGAWDVSSGERSMFSSRGHEREGLQFLEELGRRWYRLALRTASAPHTYGMRVVASVGDRFTHARRVLNFIADRYLFVRQWWAGELGN
ncbi:MAG: hypothetical protein M3214_10650 [Actinomycetota bacterium]|nr:hypothetical protein [Actinomycetota bacterium]